jgi:hypothetical protein
MTRPRTLVCLVMLGWTGTAVAQPDVPTATPTARKPKTPPASTNPPASTGTGTPIQVIQLGADGKPVLEDTTDPGDFFYDDAAGGPVYDDPQTIRIGPTPELHVVRSGDTLWDICWYYFNNPWEWPKVWSYNAQVTNPHWIYPGDLIRLIPRGLFVNDTPLDPGPNPGPDVVPPPAKRFGVQLRQTAFVEQSELDKAMKIDGSVDDKQLLSVEDMVYVSYPSNKPPQVGKVYSIYTADNPVKKGKSSVGAYVKILGRLEIRDVKKGKRARAKITDATTEIERGALVGPLIREFKTVPPVPAKVDATGEIVAMLQRDQLVGEGEVVFIDIGEKSGIEVGNRMYVVRRGDAFEQVHGPSTMVGQDDKRFPARALGEVVIVEVGPRVSIGLITLSVQEMGIGDQVLMQRASAPAEE